MGLFGKRKKRESDPYERYTSRFFKKATDDELDSEREKVRLRHCKGDERAMGYLNVFDKEKRQRYANDMRRSTANRKRASPRTESTVGTCPTTTRAASARAA